jgi:hypothetical protein
LLGRDGLLFGELVLRESEWVSVLEKDSLASLPGVSLGKANLQDNDLSAIAALTGLLSLVIKDGRGVTDNGLAHLVRASKLENLALFNTEITATGPIPGHETVVRLPARMAPFLLEVCDGDGTDGVRPASLGREQRGAHGNAGQLHAG